MSGHRVGEALAALGLLFAFAGCVAYAMRACA